MAKFTIKSITPETALDASSQGEAIHAESTASGVAAIAAFQLSPDPKGFGAAIYGESRASGPALVAINDVAGAAGPGGTGGFFRSAQLEGVHAESSSPVTAAIACYQNHPTGTGAALFAKHINSKDGTAAYFEGNVVVTGDLSFPGADFAEDFDVDDSEAIEPGTVMVLDSEGRATPSSRAYDKTVVGVTAGAGSFATGIIMDKRQGSPGVRLPVALMGKAFARVDADHGAIQIGDLLTSSPTPGHAMRVTDPTQAFGAVIGKAMAPLAAGRGLVPMVIALQ